jgi:AcrR family transcriptional regulator
LIGNCDDTTSGTVFGNSGEEDEVAGRPRGRPPRHTAAEITTTACGLADGEGLDAVTMRRVAAELGVGAASLYTYVATRDALLDLMVDAVVGEYRPPPATGEPVADVVAVGMATRDVLLRHPWAMALLETRPSTGPHGLDVLEHVLAALADHPADDTTKLEAYGAMNAVVVALVRSETTAHRMAERTVTALSDAAADGRHPHLAALRLVEHGAGEQRLRRTLGGVLDGVLGRA